MRILECDNIDLTKTNGDGQSILDIIATDIDVNKFDYSFLKVLIKREDLNINKTINHSDKTILMIAADNNKLIIADELLKLKNINVILETYDSKNALCIASRRGNYAIVKILFDYYQSNDIDLIDNNTKLALNDAAANGHSKVVKLILDVTNIDINVKDAAGNNPLLNACANFQHKVIDYLLDNEKIDINTKNNLKITPLILATENQDNKTIDKILNNNKIVKINDADEFGITPLIIAAEHNNLEIAEKLLSYPKAEINVNAVDISSATALGGAVANRNQDLVKLLLERGANFYHKNNFQVPIREDAESVFGKEIVSQITDEIAQEFYQNYEKEYLNLALLNEIYFSRNYFEETGKESKDKLLNLDNISRIVKALIIVEKHMKLYDTNKQNLQEKIKLLDNADISEKIQIIEDKTIQEIKKMINEKNESISNETIPSQSQNGNSSLQLAKEVQLTEESNVDINKSNKINWEACYLEVYNSKENKISKNESWILNSEITNQSSSYEDSTLNCGTNYSATYDSDNHQLNRVKSETNVLKFCETSINVNKSLSQHDYNFY